MPELGDFGGDNPVPGVPYGAPPVNVGPLYVPTDDYSVLGVNQTYREPYGGPRIIATIEVDFTVPGVPGLHTILIDNYAFDHADVLGYMRERSYELRGILALPGQLPPPQPLPVPLTWPHVTLDGLSATTENAQPALAWVGTIDTQNEPTTYHLEVFQIRQPDPWLVTDTVPLPPAVGATSVSGVAGPLDPGNYTAQLWANNVNGNGEAGRGPVTV